MSIVVNNRTWNTYGISMPQIPNGSNRFYFTTNMPDGSYEFYFNWMPKDVEGGNNSGWYFYCIFPDRSIRLGRVAPNAVQWSRSDDVGVCWTSSLQNIGQNDINFCKMYMLYWIY